MFGLISLHFNDKIRKTMWWLDLKNHHYANKKQKISQCAYRKDEIGPVHVLD